MILHPRLTFKLHGQAAQKTGTLSLLKLRSLAGSGWGISVKLFLRLIPSLIHSRTDYASVVWHLDGKPSAVTHTLQRLNNTAMRLALGAFRSHPLLFLRHNAKWVTALQRLDSKSDRGVIRLMSLPQTNPAAQSLKRLAENPGSRHLHPLHHPLPSLSAVSASLRCPVEHINPSLLSPLCPPHLVLHVDSSVVTGLTRVKQASSAPRAIVIYGACVHDKNSGTGAAAYAPSSLSSLSIHVDHVSSTTSHEAELVAIWLAARLARHLVQPNTTDIFLFSTSQRAILSLHQPSSPSPGQHLRRALWDYLLQLCGSQEPSETGRTVHVMWCERAP